MTGKSKWSDEIQKSHVETHFYPTGYQFPPNTPIPSSKTIERWVEKWTPIITEEIHQDKIRQEQTRKRQDTRKIPRDRQDKTTSKSYFRVPIVFLSDIEEYIHTWLSAYKKYTNGATIRRRLRAQLLLKKIEEVDK